VKTCNYRSLRSNGLANRTAATAARQREAPYPRVRLSALLGSTDSWSRGDLTGKARKGPGHDSLDGLSN